MKSEFITCRFCHKQVNIMKFSTTCPHREHPAMCKKHNRFHCANFECQMNVREINKEKGVING